MRRRTRIVAVLVNVDDATGRRQVDIPVVDGRGQEIAAADGDLDGEFVLVGRAVGGVPQRPAVGHAVVLVDMEGAGALVRGADDQEVAVVDIDRDAEAGAGRAGQGFLRRRVDQAVGQAVRVGVSPGSPGGNRPPENRRH